MDGAPIGPLKPVAARWNVVALDIRTVKVPTLVHDSGQLVDERGELVASFDLAL